MTVQFRSGNRVPGARAGAGLLAATLFTRLLEVPMGTDLFHDPFLVHDLLEAPQSLINSFAASDFYLGHVTNSPPKFDPERLVDRSMDQNGGVCTVSGGGGQAAGLIG